MTIPLDLDPDFEIFEREGLPRSLGEDEASLSATNILISKQLYERMPWAERVVLMFKAQKREIGIRAAKKDERGYKLIGRAVSSRLFCTHFGITERERFPARVRNGTLLISLSAPGEGEDV